MTSRSLFALPPIWREGRLGIEAASLFRDPIHRGHGVVDAGGQPVLLIPGFLAGDDSLGIMTRWLLRRLAASQELSRDSAIHVFRV